MEKESRQREKRVAMARKKKMGALHFLDKEHRGFKANKGIE